MSIRIQELCHLSSDSRFFAFCLRYFTHLVIRDVRSFSDLKYTEYDSNRHNFKVSTVLTTTSLFIPAEQQFQNEDDFGGDEEKSEYHKRWQNVVYCEGLVSLYISLLPKRLLKVTTKSRRSSDVILHFLRYSSFQPRRNCHFEDLLK